MTAFFVYSMILLRSQANYRCGSALRFSSTLPPSNTKPHSSTLVTRSFYVGVGTYLCLFHHPTIVLVLPPSSSYTIRNTIRFHFYRIICPRLTPHTSATRPARDQSCARV
ncbi:hypothetical protein BDQ12DRAFT_688344 [Crucibulum laeve]|uniref:Uncharacterized protein n=1 Tax=Crucibulum laeve TaxID=68775 RepID=A0A5C3LRC6_9AGAR|nr:hypothetical protein BDQ12DRAFT_688344 [Crucibulum laeve]